jgi:hypothetical protein
MMAMHGYCVLNGCFQEFVLGIGGNRDRAFHLAWIIPAIPTTRPTNSTVSVTTVHMQTNGVYMLSRAAQYPSVPDATFDVVYEPLFEEAATAWPQGQGTPQLSAIRWAMGQR